MCVSMLILPTFDQEPLEEDEDLAAVTIDRPLNHDLDPASAPSASVGLNLSCTVISCGEE